MGTATGNLVHRMRTTGHGSDYYGPCDQCGKHVSETYVYQWHREWARPDGTIYLSPLGGGAYGHRECLLEHYIEYKGEIA